MTILSRRQPAAMWASCSRAQPVQVIGRSSRDLILDRGHTLPNLRDLNTNFHLTGNARTSPLPRLTPIRSTPMKLCLLALMHVL